jgi:hypothetical protein
MRPKRKEPYAGGDHYKFVKKLVGMILYVPKEIRERYKAEAKYLKGRGNKNISAQKLAAKVLIKGAPRKRS